MRLIRNEEKVGTGGYGGGVRDRLCCYCYEMDYIPIATLPSPEYSCIKMGSDQSHFNVSLTLRDKVTRQWPQTTTFEEKGEPKRRIRTEVPLLTRLTPYR